NRFFIAVPLWNGLYTVTVLNAGSRSVATQNNYGDTGQSNLDGVVVPFVNNSYCQINTGNNSNKFQNRSFAFIAIGN
ncbi:hypothetical protein, partial [Burkholderia stagnalis]|uniref:hypothetical protein n=1 Tax=Burkholderia stagnalis TaxID=1503054 RepID=UPI000AE70E48